jgi:hypothetical protein
MIYGFFSSYCMQVNGSRGSEFTLREMSLGVVVYENAAVTEVARDGFGFEALVEGEATSGVHQLDISIYPEAYWTPLSVSKQQFLSSLNTLHTQIITLLFIAIITYNIRRG